MSWSTREIAELAGTSLRAVRHYHEVGLLEEPERRANGYKQYGVPHLVRLLRVKRLVDLGFSLNRIAETVDEDQHPGRALRTLDAELAATIERLQRARLELATLIEQRAPADLPAELTPGEATVLSETDRSLLLVMTRLMDGEQLRTYGALVRGLPAHPVNREFEALSGDAGEHIRQDLVERMVSYLLRLWQDHPELPGLYTAVAEGKESVRETMETVLRELYNPAQLDVLHRTYVILDESTRLRAGRDTAGRR
ncbi:MerR family transcriptional regulator [Streptomyces olivaceus]|uniref:helix-turn-helix domain-containing protein n=1 Tax=Streptomyces TaxID=1883 RepID=UPI0018A8476A|nr:MULTISPECIES: MerR family transcriptional regulator [Streptomyces]MBF8171769.1 MerR family transcriptional regulator [Streptomyces olivaceus]UOG83179.1 MerR family transcriptional regulator [Streptomyces sp. CB09030]